MREKPGTERTVVRHIGFAVWVSDMFRIKSVKVPLFQTCSKISRPASSKVCFLLTQDNFPDHEIKEECTNLISPPVSCSLPVVI